MLFSSVATDSLLLFAMFGSFFTIFPAVIIQLLKLMEEDDDYVPDNWEPSKMTFMQCEPVPHGLAVRIKDEIIRMTANGYIDAPDVIDGMDMYNLEITYGGISGM